MSHLKCKQCGKAVESIRSKKSQVKYCSSTCRVKWHRSQYTRRNTGLQSNTVGCINELIVAADLLKKGYDVYRTISPNARCDFIISKGQKNFKLEVTTGYKEKLGNISYPKKDKSKFDVLAIVVGDSSIHYLGEFPC